MEWKKIASMEYGKIVFLFDVFGPEFLMFNRLRASGIKTTSAEA